MKILFAIILTLILTLLFYSNAYSSPPKPKPEPVQQDQAQRQAQGQAQRQYAEGGDGGDGYGEATSTALSGAKSNADSDATSNATAAGGEASNEGNNNLTNNSSVFFSFNSSLPNAGECFGAVQGGGGGSDGGGFLGWRPLNNDCWYDRIAEAEESVELRARLKCASRMFRNAVAYETPKRERQKVCIAYMVDTYVEQIAFEKASIKAALDGQTILINDHTTRETERTSASTTRAVESCTNCFGKK